MVAGEGLAFDDDLPAVGGRAVEGGHEQVQIRCQRLHDHDLAGQRADNLRGLRFGRVVEVQPWRQAAVVVCEVAEDAFGRPRIQVAVHIVSRSTWLQAERVAAEVYRFLVVIAVCIVRGVRLLLEPVLFVSQVAFRRNDEFLPEPAQVILLVLISRKRFRAQLRVCYRLIRIPGPWHVNAATIVPGRTRVDKQVGYKEGCSR